MKKIVCSLIVFGSFFCFLCSVAIGSEELIIAGKKLEFTEIITVGACVFDEVSGGDLEGKGMKLIENSLLAWCSGSTEEIGDEILKKTGQKVFFGEEFKNHVIKALIISSPPSDITREKLKSLILKNPGFIKLDKSKKEKVEEQVYRYQVRIIKKPLIFKNRPHALIAYRDWEVQKK